MMLNERKSLKLSILVLLLSLCVCAEYDEDAAYERIESELKLIQWDLEEQCSSMARNEEEFLKGEPDGLRDKIRGEVHHAKYLRIQADKLKHYTDVPYNLKRNWTQLTKCGDALLDERKYNALNVFSNVESQRKQHDNITLPINMGTLNERQVINMLATERNLPLLENVWMQWVNGTTCFKKWYNEAIKLVHNAAIANECDTVEEYWQLLTDLPNGYEQARGLFEQIEPFYTKLRNFVTRRLERYYNITFEGELPVFVTGSLQGDDWSAIADIVLPHPQLYHDIRVELEARNVHDFYVLAANCTRNLGFGDLANGDFFKRSTFTASTCENKLLHFCLEQFSSVFTCNATSINAYLNAHELMMRLGITKVNFHAQMRESLRQSPITDALSSMASLLASNAMLQHQILHRNVFEDTHNRMTFLLLLALRIFPKIAYYHAMDEFRLELLAQDVNVTAENLYKDVKSRIQGLGLMKYGPHFVYLRDEYVLYNRPYLSKMMGEFLQFQILDRYEIDLFDETDASTLFNRDTNLKELIMSIPNDDAMELLQYYLNIDQIDAQPMLDFFAPLEEYLENAPNEQEKFVIKKASYSTTTAAPITTTTKVRKTKGTHVNLQRKLKETRSDVFAISPGINSSKEFDRNSIKTAPIEAHSQIGIFIGTGIVIITLLVIGVGCIMQKRRTHRNNREFNV